MPPQAPKCSKHNLAVGPDGRCVLCRRERARAPSTGWLVPVLALVLVAGGAFAYYRLRSTRQAPPVVARTEQPRVAPRAAPPPAPAPRAPAAAPAPTRPMPVDAALVVVARDARVDGLAAPPAAAAPPPARAPQPAVGQAELLAAMRRVPVTMYWAPWCPVCVQARLWMRANQLSVTERNIETDDAAKQEIRRYNPRGSIPTIVIDGNVYIGFGAQRLWGALDRVARRELSLPPGPRQ